MKGSMIEVTSLLKTGFLTVSVIYVKNSEVLFCFIVCRRRQLKVYFILKADNHSKIKQLHVAEFNRLTLLMDGELIQ